MHTRRDFLKSNLVAGVTWMVCGRAAQAASDESLPYELTRQTPARLYDGKSCYCHPRAGIVPGAGVDGKPAVVMTLNTLDISGSDIFHAMVDMRTDDLGQTWRQPREMETFAPRKEATNTSGGMTAASDFWPTWHAASRTLLGTGHTVEYTPDWHIQKKRGRHTIYATYDPVADRWTPWQRMEMPAEPKFTDCGAGCTQRVDEPDGTILLPIYFKADPNDSQVTVARCSFDGQTLKYLEHGTELSIDNQTRGLHEPSLARFGGRYFLTIRNDKLGLVTRSDDGLHYEPYRPWTWDDGTDLGNYNTQQHWVAHSDALYLVYTRRGANNDHVMRHRAPLFMAQIDPERLCVIRATEQILVPERGARLGNFGVTNVSPEETWVTVAEWMQPKGCEKYGSDGSVFVARIRWNKPNLQV